MLYTAGKEDLGGAPRGWTFIDACFGAANPATNDTLASSLLSRVVCHLCPRSCCIAVHIVRSMGVSDRVRDPTE